VTLPIRLRLTFWYGGLLAAALIAFSIAVYLIMAGTLQNNLDATLRQRIDHVQSIVKEESGRLTIPQGEEQLDEPLIPAVLLSPTGRLISGTLPAGGGQWLAEHQLPAPGQMLLGSESGTRLEARAIERRGRLLGYVVVWQTLRSVEDARRSLLVVLLGAGPLLLITASLGGYMLARRALRPVADVIRAASAISATDQRERVTVGPASDELSELASTFNAMIDRLQSGVDRERRFTAHASHELRSPLSVMRAEATLALDRPRSAEEYRRVVQSVDEQSTIMEDLVAGLLLLARAETLGPEEMELLAVEDVIGAAVAECRSASDQRSVVVDVSVEAGVMVNGSRSLLVRAVRNLIDNALKVSPAGGRIMVSASRDQGGLAISVIDHGPGIPKDMQERIFEPFYQLAEARTPGESHGLGLAICRQIIEAHGGSVTVESSPGKGARFEIQLGHPD
jgi:signal transduction histidine kinase